MPIIIKEPHISHLICLFRTFDPEEADYFFVPTMAGCLYDVFGWNPIPMWPPRVHGEKVLSQKDVCGT